MIALEEHWTRAWMDRRMMEAEFLIVLVQYLAIGILFRAVEGAALLGGRWNVGRDLWKMDGGVLHSSKGRWQLQRDGGGSNGGRWEMNRGRWLVGQDRWNVDNGQYEFGRRGWKLVQGRVDSPSGGDYYLNSNPPMWDLLRPSYNTRGSNPGALADAPEWMFFASDWKADMGHRESGLGSGKSQPRPELLSHSGRRSPYRNGWNRRCGARGSTRKRCRKSRKNRFCCRRRKKARD